MRNNKNPGRSALLPILAGLTLLLAAVTALGSRQNEQYTQWQLNPRETEPDFSQVPQGFEGLGFYDEDQYDSGSIFFRLTKDGSSGVQVAYVPAEMGRDALHLRLHSDEGLQIEAAGSEALGDLDLSRYQLTAEAEDVSGKNDSGAGSGIFHAGDLLPVFPEGQPFTFTLLDSEGEPENTETVIFLYSENVPSMYIDTESGSMEAIDSDKHHETSEKAQYRICLTDGTPDASGTCSIKGRGNSTWSQNKRPYNLNLGKENTLLGMNGCTKYALIANFWDSTQTRQYYAFEAASKLGLEFTPQQKFVNLYLNGRYHSLCLLTQRINVNGGTVQISDLDKKNKRANSNQDITADKLEKVVFDTDEKGNESVAVAWPNEPDDLSGGYLIEFNDRYKSDPYWFPTETQPMSFKSPEEPSVGEYQYISAYVREAEAALFQSGGQSGNGSSSGTSGNTGRSGSSDNSGKSGSTASGGAGTSNESGGSVWDYFDMDSWARMSLIQDFFVQSDDEYYSFYFYKKTGDPLLYCGPVWDFDLCLGSMNCGDYYLTSAQTLWIRDGRKRWLHQMDQYPEFRERVAQLYLEELEPIIRDLLENEYDATVDRLEKVTGLNYLRWHKNLNYRERTDNVRRLIETRVQFLHDYYTEPENFHRLLFHFAWDDFSYYVRDGESMGFLPTEEYGEKQSSPQVDANGLITGWQDTASGALLQPDEPIVEDREFDPVYAP